MNAVQKPVLVVPKLSEAAFERTHENYRTMSGVQMELETRFNLATFTKIDPGVVIKV